MFSGDIVNIYEFASSLSKVPDEYINPFKSKIKEALEAQGIEEWFPDIGKSVPDGCTKKPASEDYNYPAGTVVKVLSPGFRKKAGEGYELIKAPLVLVVSENKSEEV